MAKPASNKKSYRQIFEFVGTAQQYLARRDAAAKADAGKTAKEIVALFDEKVRPPQVQDEIQNRLMTFADQTRIKIKEGETKFTWALKRMLKRCEQYNADYSDELQRIAIANCAVDKDEIIIEDRNQFRFKREGALERIKDNKKLMNELIPVEPYFAPPDSVPKNLEESEKEAFTGFVIPEKT